MRRGVADVKGTRGFTTIEVLTVIAIGMIVAVLGFSGFKIFNHREPPKSAGERFSHALSTARTFAVSRNGYYRVSLDLDEKNFWIDEIPNPSLPVSDPNAGEFRPKVVSPEGVDHRVNIEGVLQAGNTALATTGVQSFIFRPDGSADRDARVYFYSIEDDPTDSSSIFTVRIYGPTGHNKLFTRQRV